MICTYILLFLIILVAIFAMCQCGNDNKIEGFKKGKGSKNRRRRRRRRRSRGYYDGGWLWATPRYYSYFNPYSYYSYPLYYAPQYYTNPYLRSTGACRQIRAFDNDGFRVKCPYNYPNRVIGTSGREIDYCCA